MIRFISPCPRITLVVNEALGILGNMNVLVVHGALGILGQYVESYGRVY